MALEDPVKRTAARVARVEALTATVRRLVLSPSEDYHWRAGQYVAIRRRTDDGPDSYYSFASAEKEGGPSEFELAIAAGPATIGELNLDDDVQLAPAGGRSILSIFPVAAPLVLIGMGTGVAPLRAVIQEAGRASSDRAVTLLHGCRTEADMLFSEEFRELQQNDRLRYLPVLSRADNGWAGLRGRVQAHLESVVTDEACFAVCGSLEMIGDVALRLSERNVNSARVFAEGY